MALHPHDELYAYFGAAALGAQTFEQNVALALMLRGRKEDVERALSGPKPSYQGLASAQLSSLTLGRLIQLLKDSFGLPEDVATQFAEALQLRNALMHGYFPRNARRLHSDEGRAEMIRELEEATEVFYRAFRTVGKFAVAEGDELIALLERTSSNSTGIE